MSSNGNDPTLRNSLIIAAHDALDAGRWITCAATCELIAHLEMDEAILGSSKAPWDEAPARHQGFLDAAADTVNRIPRIEPTRCS